MGRDLQTRDESTPINYSVLIQSYPHLLLSFLSIVL